MPNTVIGGFRYAKSRSSMNYEPVEECPVASGYGTGIFQGDCLKRLADGTVAVAAAGEAVYAVMIDVKQMKVAGKIEAGTYLPAGTTYSGSAVKSNPQASVVRCCPVENQIFEAAMNTAVASEAAAQLLVNSNFDIAAGAGGSTSSGRSSQVVDVATAGTATAQVRLLEFQRGPMNDVTANNWSILVAFNEGTEPSPTSATGV